MKKEESKAFHGLAVLMMMFHHYFLITLYFPPGFLKYPGFVEHIARTGRMCVAIFSFISGYGIYHVLKKSGSTGSDFGQMLKRILQLYIKLWVVILLCVVLPGLIMKTQINPLELLVNMLAIEPTYNGTWWYVRQYLWMLLAAPFMKMILQGGKRERITAFAAIAILAAVMLLMYALPAMRPYLQFFRDHVQTIFVVIFFEGYLAAYLQDTKKEKFKDKHISAVIPILLMLAAVVFRYLTSNEPGESRQDILAVPVFIWGMVYVFRKAEPLRKLFGFFGKYSLYMWLVHAYFWFLTYVKLTSYGSPLLYYLAETGMTFAAAFVLQSTEDLLKRLLRKRSSMRT